MEGGRQSRLEKLRRETEDPEVLDGLHDILEKNASLGHDVFERPAPTGSYTGVPSGNPEISAPIHQGTDAGQIAVAGMIVGILGVEMVRWARHKADTRKVRQHDSDG